MKRIQLLKSCILPIVITALFTLPADCQAEETHKLSGLQQIPFWEVTVSDQFWAPRLETNRTVTIPHNFKKCGETGQIDNFSKAAGLMKGKFVGFQWNDSDVYKSIEGACYSLSVHPDPNLDRYIDELITKIAAAQESDGYLYTPRTIRVPGVVGTTAVIATASLALLAQGLGLA